MRHSGERSFRRFTRMLPRPDRRILEQREVLDVFLEEAHRAPRTQARATAQDFALFARPWGFRFEDIQSPVHVFHGELDVNVPVAHGRLQADRIPNAKLHYFPDQAHLLCVPHAESVLRCAAGFDRAP